MTTTTKNTSAQFRARDLYESVAVRLDTLVIDCRRNRERPRTTLGTVLTPDDVEVIMGATNELRSAKTNEIISGGHYWIMIRALELAMNHVVLAVTASIPWGHMTPYEEEREALDRCREVEGRLRHALEYYDCHGVAT